MVLKNENCRVCGSSEGKAVHAQSRNYHKCQYCQTLQMSITETEYLNINPGYDPGAYLVDRTEDYIRAFLKVKRKRKLLKKVVKVLGHSTRGLSFLDVGCGMGGYMLAAQDMGMDVVGFEPSSNHGKVATEILNLPVIEDYFSSDKVNEKMFDVILLSHVIEHIYTPKTLIDDLVSVLKPGGVLLMVTPNASSLTAISTGKNWPMLVPIDHVTMLSNSSFKHLSPKNCTVSISTNEQSFEFLATWGSVIKSRLNGKKVPNIDDTKITERNATMDNVSLGSQLLKLALSIGSLPFYIFSKITRNAAALYIMVQKDAN